MANVGVLALQGGYASHAAMLEKLGHHTTEVRTAHDLEGLSGLCLPGGESTTQYKLIERWKLGEPLSNFVRSGRPILATCAGLILAASKVESPAQVSYGWLDVTVSRNAWGRQLDSFEATPDQDSTMPLVFIRAPRITQMGPTVETLATYRDEPILIRQSNITAATFHPELTQDTRIHQQVFGQG